MKILISVVLSAVLSRSIEAKLRLLSVVFRHGDRAPDSKSFEAYPNDPYANDSFYPIGPSGLTNTGKQREYALGEFLRNTYDDFLGPVYYPGETDARSTFVDRTKMSLELVLAALYPPRPVQRWNDHVDWQPIPVRFVPHLDDAMMFAQECPRFLEYLSRARATPEYRAKLTEIRPFMDYLTLATGKRIDNEVDMYYLYHGLSGVRALNLPLPEWAEGIFPYGRLYDGTLLYYEVFSYNDRLRRVYGGMLLRKITDDMTAACDGSLHDNGKLFLYAGHEFNVAAVMQALNVYWPHVPSYSAAIIFELHEEGGECRVKVKYYRGIANEGETICAELRVPGCDTGYLGEFKDAVGNHVASDEDIDSCDKRSVPEFLQTHGDIPTGITDTVLRAIEQEEKERGKLT